MAIDAIIKEVRPSGRDCVLVLEGRDGGLPGQEILTILDYAHLPIVGQVIWGGADTVQIEPFGNIKDVKRYRRKGYTELTEEKPPTHEHHWEYLFTDGPHMWQKCSICGKQRFTDKRFPRKD